MNKNSNSNKNNKKLILRSLPEDTKSRQATLKDSKLREIINAILSYSDVLTRAHQYFEHLTSFFFNKTPLIEHKQDKGIVVSLLNERSTRIYMINAPTVRDAVRTQGTTIYASKEDVQHIMGHHGNDRLFGDKNNNVLLGDKGKDFIDGGWGNDIIDGGDDNDLLCGNAGEDILVGGKGNDNIDGGNGVDIFQLSGDAREYRFHRRPNGIIEITDTINNRDGADTVRNVEYFSFHDIQNIEIYFGTQKKNTFSFDNKTQSVLVYGYAENDIIKGSLLSDVLYGGTNDDQLDGNSGNDFIYGEEGDDVINGGQGDDVIDGGEGSDILQLSGSPHEYRFTFYEDGSIKIVDQIANRDGIDMIRHIEYLRFGNRKNMPITFGQQDNDRLYGNCAYPGVLIYAGNGDDTITGSHFRDMLFGGPGNDIIDGGDGDDLITGGTGDDIVDGGLGLNTFYLSGKAHEYIFKYRGDGSIEIIDQVANRDGIDIVRRIEYISFHNIQNLELYLGHHGENIFDFKDRHSGVLVYAYAGQDTIIGSQFADVLHAGKDADILKGGKGNDIYLFDLGNGNDTIIEDDITLDNQDTIHLGKNILSTQLWFSRHHDDLQIQILGTQDSLIISKHFAATSHQIERIELDDGSVLTTNGIDQLVTAMSNFTPPASLTLPTEYQVALNPILAASWQ